MTGVISKARKCLKNTTIVLALIFAGCSTLPESPPKILKASESIEKIDLKSLDLLDLPKIGAPIRTENGWEFSDEDKQKIKELRIAAKANKEVAEQLMDELRLLLESRNRLIKLMEIEEQKTDLFAEQWWYAEKQLDRERLRNKIDRAIDIIIIIVLGGAAL